MIDNVMYSNAGTKNDAMIDYHCVRCKPRHEKDAHHRVDYKYCSSTSRRQRYL